jgi:hypothetical protein
MPYCPECKSEYEEGILKCSDCGTDLVPQLDEEKEETHFPDGEYTLVYVSTQIIDVDMVKANLEGAGIESFVLNQSDSNNLDATRMNAKLFVKAEDAKDALSFIQNLNEQPDITEEEE